MLHVDKEIRDDANRKIRQIVYQNPLYLVNPPKSFKYWLTKLNETIEWSLLYKIQSKSIVPNKIKECHCKCLNNALLTVECNYLEYVWKITENLIQKCLKSKVKLCPYDITLGSKSEKTILSNLSSYRIVMIYNYIFYTWLPVNEHFLIIVNIYI